MKWEDVKKGDYVFYKYGSSSNKTAYVSYMHTVTKSGIKYDDVWASDNKLFYAQSLLFNMRDEFEIIDIGNSLDEIQLKHAELFI